MVVLRESHRRYNTVYAEVCFIECFYCKNLDYPPKNSVIILKFEQCGFAIRVMHPKDVDGMAISVDPYQDTLFAQTCLTENLGYYRILK